MFAETLISLDILPLKKADTCNSAVVFMHNWGISELPVVENNKVLGYLSLDEICNEAPSAKIEKYIKSDKQIIASTHQHIFELIKIFDDNNLSTISILNDDGDFIGIVSYKDIFKSINRHSSLAQNGGVITLEMSAKDYSLSELSRIVEYDDVNILNVYINSTPNEANTILVSLKFNHTDLKNVIASLRRHGKIIKGVSQAETTEDSFSNRYDWLIKYLNT